MNYIAVLILHCVIDRKKKVQKRPQNCDQICQFSVRSRIKHFLRNQNPLSKCEIKL